MNIFDSKIIKPMLASRKEPFSSKDYLYEIKWDGIRCLAYLDGDTVLRSRNNLELLAGYPEFTEMNKWLREKPIILDGEIVVMKNGKPSFNEWQKRSRLKDQKQLQRIAETNPAVYIVFDILYIDGRRVMQLPLTERKVILAENLEEQSSLVISRYILEDGIDFYQAVMEQKLEGVVAKKLSSPYVPGKRTDYWYKLKRIQQRDFIICGYMPGSSDLLGSLILGAYQDDKLIYQGCVGTGISGKDLLYLGQYINKQNSCTYPFPTKIKELSRGIWLNPELVCIVEYLEKSANGLRHPVFRGLRFDKDPSECATEGEYNE